MDKPKIWCLLGLLFFVISYLFFSQGDLSSQEHIDFAHWFNLIGATLLFSFNFVFPKNRLNSVASFITTLGVIAHIGLCTIDFIMWSFGDDNVSRNELREHIGSNPMISYPFITVGPSLLFVGLATHALNFIKTNTLSSLMVILGGPFVGISFFVWNNGLLMLLSCIVFASGLALLLYRKNTMAVKNEGKKRL